MLVIAKGKGTPWGKDTPWTLRKFWGKPVWDWLQLLGVLAIPVVIAVGGCMFNAQQDARQEQMDRQRAKVEREVEEQRAQDEALQAYLNQMSTLLRQHDLRNSENKSEVRTLARARTFTVLRRLDGDRKASVLEFLYESNLIMKNRVPKWAGSPHGSVIQLDGADLSDANLRGPSRYLRFSLDNAVLSGANLRDSDLYSAGLRGARLDYADLSGADLTNNAVLNNFHLTGANLRHGFMTGVDLRGADLRNALLDGADLSYANLSDADLRTNVFKPALSFSVNKGWQLGTDTTAELDLFGPQRGQLIFTSPSRVFDPSSPSEPTKVSAPENVDEWVSWFQRHPNLDTPDPVSVTVGGAAGVRNDATLSSTPEHYPRDYCGEQPCVPLYPPGIRSEKGWKDRFIIVDVKGETVVIDVAAPTDKFDAFLLKAQKVLDTVEWKDTVVGKGG